MRKIYTLEQLKEDMIKRCDEVINNPEKLTSPYFFGSLCLYDSVNSSPLDWSCRNCPLFPAKEQNHMQQALCIESDFYYTFLNGIHTKSHKLIILAANDVKEMVKAL